MIAEGVSVPGEAFQFETRLVWWDFVTGTITRARSNGRRPEPLAAGQTRDLTLTPASPLVFLPDGRRFIAESEVGFLLLHGDTGERERLLCPADQLAEKQRVVLGGFVERSVPFALSPDGRLLAVGRDKGIHLVEVATGETRRTFQPGERALALAFSPDGRRVASTLAWGTALIWDVYPAERPADDWDRLASSPDAAHAAMSSLLPRPAKLIDFAKTVSPAKKAHAARMAAWLDDLDSPRYAMREAAQFALAKLDTDALPQIEAHLKTVSLSPEGRTRAERISAALRAAPLTPDRCRQLRILELLECLNTPEARREMARLAAGEPGYALTVEATESLARMAKRAGK